MNDDEIRDAAREKEWLFEHEKAKRQLETALELVAEDVDLFEVPELLDAAKRNIEITLREHHDAMERMEREREEDGR